MIAIIDYKAGNVRSVQNALLRLNVPCVVTSDPAVIRNAKKVIFPGVGQAAFAMQALRELELENVIRELKQPVLGICLGQQLMCSYTEEGNVKGLGIFDAKVKRFPKQEAVPHMGWNNLVNLKGPLFENVSGYDDFYFVHSYYVEPTDECIASCDYIIPFAAAIQKANFYATQFHPEKSGSIGETVLKNFIAL